LARSKFLGVEPISDDLVCIQLSDGHVDADRRVFEDSIRPLLEDSLSLSLSRMQPPVGSVLLYAGRVYQRTDDSELGWQTMSKRDITFLTWEQVADATALEYTVIYNPDEVTPCPD